MQRYFMILFLFSFFVLFVGCTSTRGIINLRTRPYEATVYLDDVKQGVTPMKFEHDFKIPATLTITKNGYYDEEEILNEAWVIREIRKGNYNEGRYMVGGRRIKSWMIDTLRRLEEKKKAQ